MVVQKENNNHIEIEKYLKLISIRDTFSNSPRNLRLLKFLVNNALEGKFVKEQIIGYELFQKKYNPDKNDATVRVYMRNLRNKLDKYYNNEGKHDKIVFIIEKGQYNIRFINRKEIESDNPSQEKRKRHLLYGATGFFLLSFLLILNFKSANTYCWNTFFKSSSKTMCVISDHFIFFEKMNNGGLKVSRLFGINNDSDLASYVRENENLKIVKADFSYFSKMAPFIAKKLGQWFMQNESDFTILRETDFKYDILKEYNLIFVGQYSTMGESKKLLLKDSKKFSVITDGFRYKDVKKDTNYICDISNRNRIDYTMVSFMPLENEKAAIFFSSNHDIGAMATVNKFTDFKQLKEFYKNIPVENKYFNALFEVKGINRTDMTCELVEIEILEY